MGVILKKKTGYYLLIALALFFMCLRGDLLIVEGVVYSVIDVIRNPGIDMSPDAASAFDAGVTAWVYMLLPAASIPFASYLSEERRCGCHLFEKQRKGTPGYLRTKIVFAFVSSAAMISVVIAAYAAVVYYFFGSAVPGDGVFFCKQVFAKYVYVQMYSFSLSCLSGLLVYVYNDMYVDMSIVLLLNYLFTDMLAGEKLVYPLVILVLTALVYVIVRKMRCDKI